MQLNAYTIALLVSALVSGGLAVFTWYRRSVPSWKELALLMLAISLWALFQCLEGMATARGGKMLWGAATYIGSQATPVLFFLFALKYTQQDRWLTAWKTALLWTVPVVSVVLAFTGGVQHLLWREVTLTEVGHAGVTAVFSHGPWYWVALVYGYLLVILGLVALARVFSMPHLYSWQARLIVLAALIPLLVHVVYSFIPSAVERLDFTPVAFTLSGILFVIAVFRYRFLDLRPLASSVLYEGIGDPMIAVDAGGRVMDVNPAAEELLGTKADELIGAPAGEAFGSIPGLARRFEEAPGEEGEDLRIDATGGRAHFSARVLPLRDRGKHLIGRLVTLHDITDLISAQEELERINAELDGFAHTVSHDLKGPLTSTGLSASLLRRTLERRGLDEDPELAQILELIENNVHLSSALIDDILALAEAGQTPGRLERVDIAGIVARVLEEQAGVIAGAGVKFEVGSDLGTVLASRVQMYQLFSNLVVNAIRHGTSENPVVEISRLPADGAALRYLVRDNGEGVPPEYMDRIFTPFFKGSSGGTGIGLSTVKKIVDLYGGSIRVYNDNGACFEFTIRDYR